MEAMEGLEWRSAAPMPSEAKRSQDPNWEQKQRLREYRIASRREKRNRKADEKKQRKLNATILRRMTRNPDKYTKNAERNRMRGIDSERRSIRTQALKQVQRLAAIHDPSGETFNIGPVKALDDGTVVSLETLRLREERRAAKDAIQQANMEQDQVQSPAIADTRKLSRKQQKRMDAIEPRPSPPKPTIPIGIDIPEGEENWLALWELTDEDLERRVVREKRRKANARKALRVKQQSGKVERRAARDEKRRVYRDLKMTWKLIKEQEKRHKTKLKSIEDQESKRISVEIATHERQVALSYCAQLGFTLDNVEGVEDIKPRLFGMKGQVVDFDALDKGESSKDIKLKDPQTNSQLNSRRVDLSTVPKDDGQYIGHGSESSDDQAGFIKLDVGDGQDFEALKYNHRVRRKIGRALETTQIRKELLVRESARAFCEKYGVEVPVELLTPTKPQHMRGSRSLPNGQLETAKGERVRLRIELTEFNNAARVLRKQAKQLATESGLRVYAEMTGRIPARDSNEETNWGVGWDIPQTSGEPVEHTASDQMPHL